MPPVKFGFPYAIGKAWAIAGWNREWREDTIRLPASYGTSMCYEPDVIDCGSYSSWDCITYRRQTRVREDGVLIEEVIGTYEEHSKVVSTKEIGLKVVE